MITFCAECYLAVRVVDDDHRRVETLVGTQSDFYRGPGVGYRCISCPDARADFYLREDYLREDLLRKARFKELSAEEYFRALMGVGTPDEMQCDAATVKELLTTKRVTDVVALNVAGATRCELRELRLEDGTTLHFGSSAVNGAIVFRITRKTSYADKVADG